MTLEWATTKLYFRILESWQTINKRSRKKKIDIDRGSNTQAIVETFSLYNLSKYEDFLV
jgi:hypothetical protein